MESKAMGHKYIELAFTEQVKNVQNEQNSRDGYARMEQGEDFNFLLSPREADFIAQRDSFYMASVSETDWPYVQHRGGAKGFLKVLDEKTLGFADFSGNRQYISTGNFRKNDRVSIILMDYPNRARMKILGRISVIEEDDWDTLAKLEDPHYRANIERGFLIHVEGFDWNCPQHITPRFTEEHIHSLLDPLIEEVEQLKSELQNKQVQGAASSNITAISKQPILGEGELDLTITGIRQLTPSVRAFELRASNGSKLPVVKAGAHIQLPVMLATGEMIKRHYSICSNPARRDIYEVAILREDEGLGGSKTIHEQYQLGQSLRCEMPSNFFELDKSNAPAILIAGGIGITPIKAMAQSLKASGRETTIHYAGRNRQEMAFRDRLEREFQQNLFIYSSAENQRLDLSSIFADANESAVFYICGPSRLIDAVILEAETQNISPERIRYERFVPSANKTARPILVKLKRSNKEIEVAADKTVLDALIESNVNIPFSCKTGVCRSCAVKVLDGDPEHHDSALSENDKSQEKLFCPCVSRATTKHLTLDL